MKFEDYKPYLSPALAKSTDLIIESGSGSYITDVNGNTYIDFVQGIAVNALGHSHPRVVRAITEQAQKLATASFNMVNYPGTLKLAKRIAQCAPGELASTFFSNGGAEATDGAIKLARAYTHRPSIIAFKGSFHGRTIGATSVTSSNSKYRKYYEPLMGGVHFAPFPGKYQCPKGMDEEERAAFCLNELETMFSYIVAPETVAAILVEPIQGEGGYIVPHKSFHEGLRKICDTHGILLMFDEIQSGYGRTGKMFASEHFGVVPDVMTLGKAIAGGLPMSAVVSTRKIMDEWHPGMHGGTFGGNPLAAAAANAVLDEFEECGVLANCAAMGAYLRERLLELKSRFAFISDIRGLGLMLAAEYSHEDGTPAPEIWDTVRAYCLAHRLMTLNCGVYGNGQRFATPLNVTRDVLDEGLAIFENALKTV
ncbi:MAG: aspartate aminotransferase family protein [Oscillospiraceae bacterium]|nr:aspartate aminotransferase family protein [Oscillospiraceae bacterium]